MKHLERKPRRVDAVEQLTTRRRILLGALGVAALLIVGRAVQLQAIESERWARAAEEQHRSRIPLPARRGAIFDRDGVPLALTHETYEVAVAPRELRDAGAAASALAQTLGISRAAARQAVRRKAAWVVLPVRATAEQRQQLTGIRGLHFTRRLERFYPQGDVGREVIGAMSGDERPLGGIEQQVDGLLRGTPGYSVVRRDAHGNAQPTISLPIVPPVDGADVYLTLDFDLQEIADGALREAIRSTRAAGGDLMITDPHTGEVLAAVSRRRGKTRPLSLIIEPFEPGSTLKPFFVASLLAGGHASLDEPVFAENGTWRDEHGRAFTDVHPHGWLTLRDALRVSSNVGMAKFVPRLDPGEQFRYLRDLGFGTPTGIEYPVEAGGRLRRPEQWSTLSAGSLAIGYEIAVTPLQLILAYGALANGGMLMEPKLVREVRGANGEVHYHMQPQPLRRVFATEVAEQVTDVLVSVVEEGTATQASLTSFAVAGKTGTARRTGASGQYESGSYTATFVGYFPAREPQIAIFVKLDQPQGAFYGGLTAAPVTRETLQALLAARTSALDGPSLLAAGARPSSAGWGAKRRSNPPAGRDGPYVFLLDEGVPPSGRDSTVRPVPVPAVEGLSLRDAVRRLHALGFYVRLRGSGVVRHTRPAAGTPLAPGDTLLLIGAGSGER